MVYILLEIIFMFLIFFIPELFLPPAPQPGGIINSFTHLGILSALFLFHIVFMIVVIGKRSEEKAEFGLVRVKPTHPVMGAVYSLGLFAVVLVLSFIISLLPEGVRSFLEEGYDYRLTNPAVIPLLFIFCILTGYREELFFRSYLFTRLSQTGMPVALAVALSVLVFSSLHFNQGWSGLIFAFLSAVYLSWLFIRERNLHTIAIAHGLFNFFSLLLSL